MTCTQGAPGPPAPRSWLFFPPSFGPSFSLGQPLASPWSPLLVLWGNPRWFQPHFGGHCDLCSRPQRPFWDGYHGISRRPRPATTNPGFNPHFRHGTRLFNPLRYRTLRLWGPHTCCVNPGGLKTRAENVFFNTAAPELFNSSGAGKFYIWAPWGYSLSP